MQYMHTVMRESFIAKLKDKYPHLKDYNIDELLNRYHSYLIDQVVGERDGIQLPLYTGNVLIGAFPTSESTKGDKIANDQQAAFINGAVTKFGGHKRKSKTSDEIYNEHITDCYRSRILYSTWSTACRNKATKFWGFKPSVQMDTERRLAFKHDWKKFVVIPNIRRMKEVFRKENFKAIGKIDSLEKEKKTYNQFDFD